MMKEEKHVFLGFKISMDMLWSLRFFLGKQATLEPGPILPLGLKHRGDYPFYPSLGDN